MKFDRRSFVAAAFALGAAVAMPAFAQNAPYTPITPAQPTEDASKIEVVEFFSYGCPHCADFNPLLHAWAAKQQGDVVVKKGVDAKKFSETFNSFGVMSKVKRGDQMAQAYKIQGVPALAVEGKFLIGGKDFNDTLAIADSLITKARSEKSGKAPAKK